MGVCGDDPDPRVTQPLHFLEHLRQNHLSLDGRRRRREVGHEVAVPHLARHRLERQTLRRRQPDRFV